MIKTFRLGLVWVMLSLVVLAVTLLVNRPLRAQGARSLGTESGFAVFQQRCMSCHGNPEYSEIQPARCSGRVTLKSTSPRASPARRRCMTAVSTFRFRRGRNSPRGRSTIRAARSVAASRRSMPQQADRSGRRTSSPRSPSRCGVIRKVRWVFQAYENDPFLVGCVGENRTENCPVARAPISIFQRRPFWQRSRTAGRSWSSAAISDY